MSAEVVICTDCQASDCLAAQQHEVEEEQTMVLYIHQFNCSFHCHSTWVLHGHQSKHSILPLTQVDSGPTVDKPTSVHRVEKFNQSHSQFTIEHLAVKSGIPLETLSVHFWNKYSEKATHTSTYNYSIKIILFLVINQCVYHSICFLSNSYYLHIIFHAEHWKLKTKRTPRELSPTENCIGLNSVRVQPKAKERAGWRLGAGGGLQ